MDFPSSSASQSFAHQPSGASSTTLIFSALCREPRRHIFLSNRKVSPMFLPFTLSMMVFKLWCMLQLEVDRDDWQQRARCYDTWLKNSRGCPLSLRIVCHGDLNEIRNVLQPYVQQISSLTLYFFLYDKPFEMDDFHALKELTILQRGNDPARAIDKSLSKLPVNLRRLDLRFCRSTPSN
ncbi:hypothetical protein CY34DRAFT_801590 [Suillus luteus UH-Slu-Lm8-n1]|uniref:Uncharacterized protein n=1 Tax=Suillus luteus UH-Slu-Lm8-n1 TaxID=930992 RepID=A0A0D0B6V2_9AGAM|nr:hypothetical protein CY34DRAFT_801590 [Suillus luteus UH-Slu-Lm8-n1]